MSNDRNASLADGTNPDSTANKAEFADHILTTKSAHTPGPWRAVGFQVMAERDGSKWPICRLPLDDFDYAANAHLIAAAPALLLELEMAVDLLERASRTLTEECKSALDGRQWGGVRIASARAAISLAKGESA